EISRTSTVAHTVSPTPLVLSNINALSAKYNYQQAYKTMTNDFDVIDNDYVQVPKIIISILQDQVAVINNLSKHHTNSKDIIYTAKGVALSKINNNWIAPFGIYKEACYVCSYYGHTFKFCPNIETSYLGSCVKCWCIGHAAKDCGNCIHELPFKQGYVTPEQLLKLFGRFED
ncbi:3411_t:CDS:2, partial [Funneliformis caledonium]